MSVHEDYGSFSAGNALCTDLNATNFTIYRDPVCHRLSAAETAMNAMPALESAIDFTYYLLCAVLVFYM